MQSFLAKYPILTVNLAWWLFWILAQTIVLHRFGWSWEVSLTDATISNGLLAIAAGVTENIYRFYQPGSKNRLYRFLWGVVLTWLSIQGIQFLLAHMFASNIEYLTFLEKSVPVRYMFALLMIAFVTVTSWLYFYIREQQADKSRKDDAEKLLRDAELSNLRQQLQPHFLFNSLNSISALAGSKPEQARKMIQQLSDFLRGTLKKDEQQLVSLADELEHLQLYLDIEKVRFGHRLNTEVSCGEEAGQMKIPTLLLQPLLENAIKFGLYDTTEEVSIRVVAEAKPGMLHITIQNPFDAETSRPKQGTGFGLNSVKRRLSLLYARNDLLNISQKETIFTSTLTIPQTSD